MPVSVTAIPYVMTGIRVALILVMLPSPAPSFFQLNFSIKVEDNKSQQDNPDEDQDDL